VVGTATRLPSRPTAAIALLGRGNRSAARLAPHTPPRCVSRLALAPDGKVIACLESLESRKGKLTTLLRFLTISQRQAHASLGTRPRARWHFSPRQSPGLVGLCHQGPPYPAVESACRDRMNEPDLHGAVERGQQESAELPGIRSGRSDPAGRLQGQHHPGGPVSATGADHPETRRTRGVTSLALGAGRQDSSPQPSSTAPAATISPGFIICGIPPPVSAAPRSHRPHERGSVVDFSPTAKLLGFRHVQTAPCACGT